MDIEAQKYVNDETQRFLDDMIKQQNAAEAQVKEQNADFEKLQFLAAKKQRDLDLLTTKIETVINKQGVIIAFTNSMFYVN